jgi:hypothetical protein
MTENMMQRTTDIIKDYQERQREMPYVPKTSFRLDSLGYCGDANKLLLRCYSVTTLSLHRYAIVLPITFFTLIILG